MRTEKDKMLSGELYNPFDPQLSAERRDARLLVKKLNDTRDDQVEERKRLIKKLLPSTGESIWIEPPFFCDYGSNIILGDDVFFNFNCVVLDVAPVCIGSRVLFGPAVQVYAATHPLGARIESQCELGARIEIGDDVWIGGGVIICPGVRIGARSVVGRVAW